jgi:hypothetical protein
MNREIARLHGLDGKPLSQKKENAISDRPPISARNRPTLQLDENMRGK